MFARGAAERPLLPALRRDYARRLLAQTPVAEGMVIRRQRNLTEWSI